MLKLTAVGSGYYRVFVDGIQVSQHTAEREAIESAADHALTGAVVYYDHDYRVDVEAAVAAPAPPVVEPIEHKPTPPPVDPAPPTDGVEIDMARLELNDDGIYSHPDLPGYRLKKYGEDKTGPKRHGLYNPEIEDGALWVDSGIDVLEDRFAAGFYFSSTDRDACVSDHLPGLAGCNRMSVDVWLPPRILDLDGTVLADRDVGGESGYVNALYGLTAHYADYHAAPGRNTGNPESDNQHFYWKPGSSSYSDAVCPVRWSALGGGWYRKTINSAIPMRQRKKDWSLPEYNNWNMIHEASRELCGAGMAESLTRFYVCLKNFGHGGFSEGRWGLSKIRFWREAEGVAISAGGGRAHIGGRSGSTVQLMEVNHASSLPKMHAPVALDANGFASVPVAPADYYTVRDLDGLGAATVKA